MKFYYDTVVSEEFRLCSTDDNCAECNNDGLCIKCKESYSLKDGKCTCSYVSHCLHCT